jgi:redox-sensitive bicupin YhaK (pirin superfamily)
MSAHPIRTLEPLSFPFRTEDPFLFCAHHLDLYPAGDEGLGPRASLAGRDSGMDFSRKDGWSMYHGQHVPGFPRHPHRGFETITVAQQGFIDHSDSLGATARFGQGDAQWMTAGRGIVHSEMFPLLRSETDNPTELFQVWLNLPAEEKMVDPYFTMFWKESIPTHVVRDEEGRTTRVMTVAGAFEGRQPPRPPPNSWASRPDSHVAIWTLTLEPGARWTLPAAPPTVTRSLYFHRGAALRVADRRVLAGHRIGITEGAEVPLQAQDAEAHVLLLQGRPLGEPVAHHGPFVMNTRAELAQAFADYQRTGFGGWPWDRDDPVHARSEGRFARHPDGRTERK